MKISLKAARVNANLLQSDVARALGVDRSTICKWERGITSPTATQFVELCRLFKIPMDLIFLPDKSA